MFGTLKGEVYIRPVVTRQELINRAEDACK
jgi:hypothetical protein